jgi:putative transposase
MPNHVHFLLGADQPRALSALMRRVQQAYQFHWRKRYGLVGHLWQGRFKSIPIEKESYLLECARYIERNPIRAELCKTPEEYPWSSARTYLGIWAKSWRFLDISPTYKGLGSSEETRRQRYRDYIGGERPYEVLLDTQLQSLT